MASMRAVDDAVIGRATLDAEVRWPLPSLPTGETERAHHRARITHDGEVWAARSYPDHDAAPPAYRPAAAAPGAFDYDRTGALLITRDDMRAAMTSGASRGEYRRLRLYTISADGTAAVQNVHGPLIALHRPATPLEAPDVYIPLLTAGRGYAALLDEVHEVDETRRGCW